MLCAVTTKRSVGLFLAGAACITVLGACGSSSSSATASSDTTAAATGDKVAFCADNATLDKASAGASTPAELVPLLKTNQSTISDFGDKAPADIRSDAMILVTAANNAITSGDATGFTTTAVQTAGQSVDTYCGQNSDGSPVSGSSTSTS